MKICVYFLTLYLILCIDLVYRTL